MLSTVDKAKDDSSNTTMILVENVFKFLITFVNALFNLLNSPSGLMWGILIFLTIQTKMMVKASPVSSSAVDSYSSLNPMMNYDTTLDTPLHSMRQGQSFMFYPTEQLEASSFITRLDKIHQKEVYGIKVACDAIKAQQKICIAHPASCQSNQKSSSNYERTIRIRTKSLLSLKKVCEPSSYILAEKMVAKCHGDFKWVSNKSKTEKLTSLSPHFGKFTSLFSRDSTNSVHRANDSQNMIKNLLSHSEVLESSNYEKYRSVIKKIVTNVYTNLTTSEREELTSLSTEHTSIVSMAMPISGSELECKNMLLVRTTITPILNPETKKEVVFMDGRLIEKYGNHSTYTLLPQDSAMSKETSPLKQVTSLVGRSCIIHKSINATSTNSNDTLIEVLSFQLLGNLKIEIICPGNNSLSSNTKILTSGNYKLRLPLVCSLHSERINCESVTLHSTVIADEKNGSNSTSFVRNNISEVQAYQPVYTPLSEKVKWPLIGSLSAIACMVTIGLICAQMLRRSKKLTVTSNNDTPAYNPSSFAPSCPSASQIQDSDKDTSSFTPPRPSTSQVQVHAPAKEITPPSQAAIAIKKLLAIPTAIRNSSETEALIIHMEHELTPLSQVERINSTQFWEIPLSPYRSKI